MTATRSLAVLLLLLVLGCGDGTLGDGSAPAVDYQPLEAPEDFPGPVVASTALDPYFEFLPYRDSDCWAAFANLGLQRELLVLVGNGDFWVHEFTRGLQRFSSLFGLSYLARHEPYPVALDWIIDDDAPALQAHLEERFPGVDFASGVFEGTEEEYLAIKREVSRFQLRPVIDVAHLFGDQGQGVTLVIFVRAMSHLEAQGDGQYLIDHGTVLGMAWSQALTQALQALGRADDDPWGDADLGDYTPMLFVNAGALTTLVHGQGLNPVAIDLVMAHEMGHTYGLTHVGFPSNNLMNPGFERPSDVVCETMLDAGQLATIRQAVTASDTDTASLGLASSNAPVPDRAAWWGRLVEHLQGRRPLPLFH